MASCKMGGGVGKDFGRGRACPGYEEKLRTQHGVESEDPTALARGVGKWPRKGLKSSPGPWKGGKKGRLHILPPGFQTSALPSDLTEKNPPLMESLS